MYEISPKFLNHKIRGMTFTEKNQAQYKKLKILNFYGMSLQYLNYNFEKKD